MNQNDVDNQSSCSNCHSANTQSLSNIHSESISDRTEHSAADVLEDSEQLSPSHKSNHSLASSVQDKESPLSQSLSQSYSSESMKSYLESEVTIISEPESQDTSISDTYD